jgi:hypothetical protein
MLTPHFASAGRVFAQFAIVVAGAAVAAATVSTADAANLPAVLAQQGPPAALVRAIQEDAARRAGIPIANVQVVQAAARTWPDGGLGCPRPGEVYIQVITPGYLMVLRAGNRTFEYHSDDRDQFTLCREAPAASLPITGGGIPLWPIATLALGCVGMGIVVARRGGRRAHLSSRVPPMS